MQVSDKVSQNTNFSKRWNKIILRGPWSTDGRFPENTLQAAATTNPSALLFAEADVSLPTSFLVPAVVCALRDGISREITVTPVSNVTCQSCQKYFVTLQQADLKPQVVTLAKFPVIASRQTGGYFRCDSLSVGVALKPVCWRTTDGQLLKCCYYIFIVLLHFNGSLKGQNYKNVSIIKMYHILLYITTTYW